MFKRHWFVIFILILAHAALAEEGQIILNDRIKYDNSSPWSSTYWGAGAIGGKANSHFTSTNVLFLNYSLGNQRAIGLVAAYEAAPFADGKSFAYSPTFRISDNSVVSSPIFKLFSDLRFTIPLALDERLAQADVRAGVRTTQIFTLRPHASSRFSLKSFNWVRYQWFGQEKMGRKLGLLSRSTLNYDLNSTASLAWVAMFSGGIPNSLEAKPFAFDSFRTGPGIQWNVNRNIILSPYLTYNLMSPAPDAWGGFLMSQIRLF